MKVVCNIPFMVNQSGGEPLFLAGDPKQAAQHIAKHRPDLELLCVAGWDIRANRTELLVRVRKGGAL